MPLHPANGVQNQGIPVNQEALEALQSAVHDWGIYSLPVLSIYHWS